VEIENLKLKNNIVRVLEKVIGKVDISICGILIVLIMRLNNMLNKLLELINSGKLSELIKLSQWDSLVINRRQPITYRLFTRMDDLRICLHKFKPCDRHESFYHPHPWPAAFVVLSGGYYMRTGRYKDFNSDENDSNVSVYLRSGSGYEMTDPLLGHSITPVTDTYTIMINGPEYEKQHIGCRRTKGKDLEKLSDRDKEDALLVFNALIGLYKTRYSFNKN
jgi:hypothetical protein